MLAVGLGNVGPALFHGVRALSFDALANAPA